MSFHRFRLRLQFNDDNRFLGILVGVVVFFVFFGLLLLLSNLVRHQPGSLADTTTTTLPASGVTTTTWVRPTATVPQLGVTSTSEPTAALTDADVAQLKQVITDFMTAWARPEVSQDVWLNALRPHASNNYMTLLGTVDNSNISATKLTGPVVLGELKKTPTTFTDTATVETDAGKLVIGIIYNGGDPQIDDIEPLTANSGDAFPAGTGTPG